MLTIDGSLGEGGGQVLRSALTLSLVTGTPFRLVRVRARRPKPGLQRQHLAALRAAAAVGDAEVSGDALHSTEIGFRPRGLVGGAHRFDIGSAGSATLVLQTVLLPLLRAATPSTVQVTGGTHNPHAPPWEFLERTYLALLRRMGAKVDARLERAGFYPAGGGVLAAGITPSASLAPLELPSRGELRAVRGVCRVARLPAHIAEREQRILAARIPGIEAVVDARDDSGPGNVCFVELESEALTEVFTAVGEKGRRAEAVADGVAREVEAYLATPAPVGPHLADQLLLPLALGSGGAFATTTPTLHFTTHVDVIHTFLPRVEITVDGVDGVHRVSVTPR